MHIQTFKTVTAGVLLLVCCAGLSAVRPHESISPLFQLSAVSSTDQALSGMTYTMYHPNVHDTTNDTREGGIKDAFGRKIYTALDVEKARASGDATAGSLSNPITLASDPSRYGEVYYIPSYTFTTIDENGVKSAHTVTNVYGKVTDTGGDFKGRPDKIDIATDYVQSTNSALSDKEKRNAARDLANQEDRLPNNSSKVQLIPANDQAKSAALGQRTEAVKPTASTPQASPLNTVTAKVIQTASTAVRTVTGFSTWMTVPFCYKSTGPAVQGFVAPATSCNAGYIYTPNGPVFVPDCGMFGVACQTPTGCLNAVCAGTPNAIWDPISKKCGCG